MSRKQEEAILRITARYVSEAQEGLHPSLSDYLARYPRYANAIADFVAYYHAIEADTAPLSLTNTGMAAVAREVQSFPACGGALLSLLITANGQQLTPSQLAAQIDLSRDIVLLLEQQRIELTTLPRELIMRLARALQYPASTIQAYFVAFQRDSPTGQHVVQQRQLVKVAEERMSYPFSASGYTQSFRSAIIASVHLSPAQKQRWCAILDEERL